MKKIGIYKIENKVNGKVYIGQSIDIGNRLRQHRYRAFNQKDKKTYSLYLYAAIRKYGKDNFTYSIVELCDKSQLDERERYWISYYRSNEKGRGYNLSDGGDSKYISEQTKGSNLSEKKQRVEQIKDLLIHSDLQIKEIAKLFGVTKASVTNINIGRSWYCLDSEYPLRPRVRTIYRCPQCGNRVSTKYSKLCRKCDSERQHLKRGHFPGKEAFAQDLDNYGLTELSKKYGVSQQTVFRWSKKYNLPLKGWNQTRRLKYEQVQQQSNDENHK